MNSCVRLFPASSLQPWLPVTSVLASCALTVKKILNFVEIFIVVDYFYSVFQKCNKIFSLSPSLSVSSHFYSLLER